MPKGSCAMTLLDLTLAVRNGARRAAVVRAGGELAASSGSLPLPPAAFSAFQLTVFARLQRLARYLRGTKPASTSASMQRLVSDLREASMQALRDVEPTA